MIKMTQEIWNY